MPGMGMHTLSSTSYKVSGWISVVSTKTHRTLQPGHVVGLLQQALTSPTGNGKHGRVLFDEIFLAPDFDHHALHLVRDLVVLFLLAASSVAMHLGTRSRLVMERSGRTQKKSGYVSCHVNDEDKACCRLQRRLRASMADQRRLLMGPNEKLPKKCKETRESPPTLVYCLLTCEKNCRTHSRNYSTKIAIA